MEENQCMGRNQNPLYLDPSSNIYFARQYIQGKRTLLTLNTRDILEAMRRLPIVQTMKMSWVQYQKKIDAFLPEPPSVITGIGPYKISPPVKITATKAGTLQVLEEGLRKGNTTYNKTTEEWEIHTTDGTTDLQEGLKEIKESMAKIDNSSEITAFYKTTIPQLYIDKITANRLSDLWLRFLSDKGVSSWAQITEQLMIDFVEWRKSTKVNRGKAQGISPSGLVVNRHIQFLRRSFEEARDRGYMKFNPVKNWRPEKHEPNFKSGLALDELKKVLSDVKLTASPIFDVIKLLFTSCKRRKEIVGLLIENINLEKHWVFYKETKNSSKGTSYSIRKAFWTTPLMEKLLKRIIAGRKSGPLFPDIDPDDVSALFEECADRVAPEKNVSLHNLRHTATTIMENAGLTDDEIDAALGHYNVKTALPHYQDRSADALAARLAGRTKKGIEVLSKAVKEFLV